MSTSKTRAELVAEALGKLLVLEAGQPPSDEDASTVDGKVDTTISSLDEDDIVLIDPDAIPNSLFDDLAALLAERCGPEFGRPVDPRQVAYYEGNIRRKMRVRPIYGVLEMTDY